MKKLISILLSLSLLFSITYGMDFYAKADNEKPYKDIAQTVMAYNTNIGYNYTGILGADNNSKNNMAVNYDTYVLPLADMGLKAGDVLICNNSQDITGFLFNLSFLDENWDLLSESGWTHNRDNNKKATITDNMNYITFRVINSYGVNNPFNKADIPFEDFKLYKNSVSDANEIDYISIWEKMIEYDNNTEFTYELWCHNMDLDYQNEHSYTGKTMQDNLEFFDGFDIDVKTTSDGIKVCWYNNNKYNVPEHTYAELKENYPQVMTYEDMLKFIKDTGKKIFVVPFGDAEVKLAEEYGVCDRVFAGTENRSNPSLSRTGNLYMYCQTSAVYDIELYKKNKELNDNFYLNTDIYFSKIYGGGYFTDEQINELAENDINIGLSFCMQHRITQFIDFCRTHDESVFDKINHLVIENENSLECLKAAMRYTYGMCRHTQTQIENIKPALCTEDGYSGDVYCKECGKLREKGVAIPAAGHTFITETQTTPATEDADGKIEEVERCSACNEEKSRNTVSIIPKVSTIELQKTTIGYNWYYTGKQITPSVTVKDSTGTALKRGTDYSLTYDSGRVNVGKYSITVTLKGNYSGTKTFTFEIVNKPVNKWIKSGNRWWYRHADGSYTKNNWEKISGKWYHFDKSGWMQTGWLKDGGKWYYLNSSGAMATGWVKVSNKWYYMNTSGVMQTGWLKLSGKWYYLNSSGVMLTGRQKIGKKWYTFNSSGVWIK